MKKCSFIHSASSTVKKDKTMYHQIFCCSGRLKSNQSQGKKSRMFEWTHFPKTGNYLNKKRKNRLLFWKKSCSLSRSLSFSLINFSSLSTTHSHSHTRAHTLSRRSDSNIKSRLNFKTMTGEIKNLWKLPTCKKKLFPKCSRRKKLGLFFFKDRVQQSQRWRKYVVKIFLWRKTKKIRLLRNNDWSQRFANLKKIAETAKFEASFFLKSCIHFAGEF